MASTATLTKPGAAVSVVDDGWQDAGGAGNDTWRCPASAAGGRLVRLRHLHGGTDVAPGEATSLRGNECLMLIDTQGRDLGSRLVRWLFVAASCVLRLRGMPGEGAAVAQRRAGAGGGAARGGPARGNAERASVLRAAVSCARTR
jgi:hypothetical protein